MKFNMEWLKHVLYPTINMFNHKTNDIANQILFLHEELSELRKENMELLSVLQQQMNHAFIENGELDKKLAMLKREILSAFNESNISLQQIHKKEQIYDDYITVAERKADDLLMKQTDIKNILSSHTNKFDKLIRQLNEELNKKDRDNEQIEQFQKGYTEQLKKIQQRLNESNRNASEAVWAQIFKDTICNSSWLNNKTFSPGRWAVGYPFLYVMYRIFNEAKPTNILELGLGQSTKMAAQYTATFSNVRHTVIEHDLEWINFFKNNVPFSKRTEIIQLDLEMVIGKNGEKVRSFKNFKDALKGKKFDYICIDAPLGQDMKEFSRVDILDIIPECLMNNFIIMIDDYERKGEKNTVELIKKVLDQAQISYQYGKYSGKKDCALICAEKFRFFCSL